MRSMEHNFLWYQFLPGADFMRRVERTLGVSLGMTSESHPA